jgi:methyl-accepting chemotaxis protein
VKSAIKRKKLVTSHPVQLKYLIFTMFAMLVPMLVFGGALYFLIFNILGEQIAIPEYVAANLIPAIQKINLILLIGFPPLVVLLFIWGAILSHRFAGPLQRLQREVEEIASSGDFRRRIKVRKNDDIREMADAINKVLAKACEGRAK